MLRERVGRKRGMRRDCVFQEKMYRLLYSKDLGEPLSSLACCCSHFKALP